AMRLAQATAPDGVVSRLAVGGATVRIDVRIVEVSQRRLQEVGAGLALDDGHVAIVSRTGALGPTPAFLQAGVDTRIGQYRLQAALRALEDLGEARVVADPTLVAKPGAVARFRAGGELPVPVPADDQKVVVEFRPYGAALDIKPDVLGNGAIRLQLQAELSEPDPLNQIAISGVNVPALIVRRVATTVDLRDGETFLVAGLLEDEQREAGVSTPGLSKIPFIGGLLGAKQSRDTQRELAILVTPHLGKAAPGGPETVAAAPLLDEKPAAAVETMERAEREKPRPRGLRGLYADLKTLLKPPVRWIGGHVQRLFAADRGSVRRA
ncbi:MAG: hypothetical protein U1C74_11510, partial [Phenylobacterium sp.]|nr:hypothetical protein [Phenylobacterium sp.]